MVAKKVTSGCGIEGVPDPHEDKTFEFLVAGQARVAPRTAGRFLRGEDVGRSDSERESLRATLNIATREAVALRRVDSPLTREDEGLGKALGKAAAQFKKGGAR